jgi:hypothetical protein
MVIMTRTMAKEAAASITSSPPPKPLKPRAPTELITSSASGTIKPEFSRSMEREMAAPTPTLSSNLADYYTPLRSTRAKSPTRRKTTHIRAVGNVIQQSPSRIELPYADIGVKKRKTPHTRAVGNITQQSPSVAPSLDFDNLHHSTRTPPVTYLQQSPSPKVFSQPTSYSDMARLSCARPSIGPTTPSPTQNLSRRREPSVDDNGFVMLEVVDGIDRLSPEPQNPHTDSDDDQPRTYAQAASPHRIPPSGHPNLPLDLPQATLGPLSEPSSPKPHSERENRVLHRLMVFDSVSLPREATPPPENPSKQLKKGVKAEVRKEQQGIKEEEEEEGECNCKTAANKKKQGRHATGCPKSKGAKNTEKALPKAIRDLGIHLQQLTKEDPVVPVEEKMVSGPPPASFADIPLLPKSVLRSIPTAARASVGEVLALILRRLHPDKPDTWWRLMAFSRLVLGGVNGLRGPARSKTVMRRSKLCSFGMWADLWEQASGPPTARVPESYTTNPVEDLLRFSIPHLADQVPIQALTKAVARVRQGECGRAMCALSCAASAPANLETFEKLERLHPKSDPPPLTETEEGVENLENIAVFFSPATIASSISSFPRGSSGGVSGLTPDHLRELMRDPSTDLLPALRHALILIATGRVPAEARPFIYGAKLSALAKKDGGVRPIACGETLRRLCGKILCRQGSEFVGEYLLSCGQVGVGIPAGAEAMLRAAQILSDERLPGEVLVKLDFSNAFNTISREALLEEVRTHVPFLLPYARAAYGFHSRLQFGDRALLSECGVQQGDPLGPLLFSLVLARATVPSETPLHRFFYLDDGLIVGPAAHVEAYLRVFEEAASGVGLRLNRAKCEAIGELPVADLPQKHPSRWDLLGVPLGSDDHRQNQYRSLIDKATATNHTIATVASVDPHAAFGLLRACGGAKLLMYHMRALGPIPALQDFDESQRGALTTIVGPISGQACAAAFLPVCLGGLGFQSAHAIAPAAFISSRVATRSTTQKLLSNRTLPDNAITMICLAALGPCPDALELARTSLSAKTAPPKLQKLLSALVTINKRKALLEDPETSLRLQVAVSSGSREHAGYWLSLPPGIPKEVWLPPRLFVTAVRHRLADPIGQPSYECDLCAARISNDEHGDHLLTCMAGGKRTLIHDTLRNKLGALASQALMGAKVGPEVQCLPRSPGLRMDIVLRGGQSKDTLIDVAMTHPYTTGSIQKGIAEPGGAATAYETIKKVKYRPFVDDTSQEFVPMIIDTFGAWGKSALPCLDRLAHAYALRRSSRHESRIFFFGSLNAIITSGVAQLLATGLVACE